MFFILKKYKAYSEQKLCKGFGTVMSHLGLQLSKKIVNKKDRAERTTLLRVRIRTVI